MINILTLDCFYFLKKEIIKNNGSIVYVRYDLNKFDSLFLKHIRHKDELKIKIVSKNTFFNVKIKKTVKDISFPDIEFLLNSFGFILVKKVTKHVENEKFIYIYFNSIKYKIDRNIAEYFLIEENYVVYDKNIFDSIIYLNEKFIENI